MYAGAIGAEGSYTLAGPPERMNPLGLSLRNLLCRCVVGENFAVNVALAHPPGDQHAVLGPEIQDDNGFRLVAAFRLHVGVESLCLTYLTARYLKVGGDF